MLFEKHCLIFRLKKTQLRGFGGGRKGTKGISVPSRINVTIYRE